MTDIEIPTNEHNNLDELCRMKSTCVLPYCGQKIDGSCVPQQLLKMGVKVPVPVARTAINRYIRHARFTFHNWCSQHCCWAVFWILLSSFIWTGVMFLLVGAQDDYYCDFYSNGRCESWNYTSNPLFDLGLTFVLFYLITLFLHIGGCIAFRCMSRKSVRNKLSSFNSQLAPYHCLATVVNSKYGCSFNLVFFYYDIEPCVKQLADILQVEHSYGQSTADGRWNQMASSSTQNQTNQFEVSARSLIHEHSPKYLQNFIEKDLPDVTSQRHTLQKSCLCQYVQMSLQQTGTGSGTPMMFQSLTQSCRS